MTATASAGFVRRFWTARDAQLRLDAGYLSDPEGQYAALLGPHPAVSLDTLDDIQCIVLLGEPGSGKTTALHHDIERLMSAAGAGEQATDEVVLHLDLRDYAEVADLRAALFQHPALVHWKAATHRLTLALDSLDEALIEMRKLSTRLASELRELPVERLRVRIACRTADWPSVLEREVGELWGEEQVRVLEIAPLRRRDVLELAAARLGEERADLFVAAVAAQDAEPFAGKPGTLGFLISSFAQSGRLPASQVELYTIGCRALCEETNQSRRAARRTGELSADQRVAVAARVAAATILGGRPALWTGVDRHGPPSDLRCADLIGEEPMPHGSIRVDERVLRDDVLSTGLFSARGPERLGWAHQTYGEFLAASWLTRRALLPEQVLALLTVNDGVGRKLVPQLRETAAWVASLRPELFLAIMDIEPSVLLRSDVAGADAASRERLVAALLDGAERNTLPAPEFGQILLYRRLQHPQLGEQLRTVIADSTRPDRVRDLALDIAIACGTREVAAVAADLALDSSAKIYLRATAARAVAGAGHEAEAARLRPLALGNEQDDEADDLKGNALRATWRTIAPAELFAGLSRAKRPNVGGAYDGFLSDLAESLPSECIAPGLLWIERLGYAASPGEQELEATVIVRAFSLIEDPVVRGRLVRIVRRAILKYEPLLNDRDEDRKGLSQVLADSVRRRRLLSALVEDVVTAASAPPSDAPEGEVSPPPDTDALTRQGLDVHAFVEVGYLAEEDFDFVLDSLASVPTSPGHRALGLAWGHLARGMLDVRRIDHADAILERAAVPRVREVFGQLIDPIELDGPEAEAARRREREQEAERQKWAARRAKWESQNVEMAVERTPLPSAARLAEALQTTADPERPDDLPRRRWINVYLELLRDEKGEVRGRGATGEVRAGIAWREGTADVRVGAVEAAGAFVELAAAPQLDPDDGVHFHGYAWAGYVALRLLATEAPDRLDRLDAEAWARWAPTVALAEPYGDALEEQGAHVALAHRARAAATDAFDAAVRGAVDHALATGNQRVPESIVVAFATTPLGAAVLVRCLDALDSDLRAAAAEAAARPLTLNVTAPGPAEEGAAESEAQRQAHAREARTMTSVVLLGGLLRGGAVEARATLVHAIKNSGPLASLDLASPHAELALVAAHSLLQGAEDSAWGVISKVIEAAPAFASTLFLRMARSREIPIRDFRERLGLRGVGDLFVALAKAFPYDADPWHNGVYSPSARDNVMTWRRAMLNALEEWGSPEAILELQRIQAALPQYDWLGFSVARARDHQGRAAWLPVSPADLFALADDRGRRLVRDGDELLNLVVETLRHYQRELQGDLPAVVGLWDYSVKTQPRPRDEGHLADDIARHLKREFARRGIAVGCELVVRRGGKGRAPGMRTDVYVTGVVSSAIGTNRTDGEIATVVIEVKGSWHEEVETAMRTQLVKGYLSDYAGARHGLYFVGDYTCESWADCAESRRSRSLGGLNALQHRLDAQAEELSQGGVRVKAVVLDTSLPDT